MTKRSRGGGSRLRRPPSEPEETRRRFLFEMAGAGIGSALIAEHAVNAADILKPLRIVNLISESQESPYECDGCPPA